MTPKEASELYTLEHLNETIEMLTIRLKLLKAAKKLKEKKPFKYKWIKHGVYQVI